MAAWDLHTYKNDYTSGVYKNFNHRVNHSNFIRSTNPGPIDPIQTIQAPYSQDNVVLFGLNAGTQCVAMSHHYYLPTEIMVFHPISGPNSHNEHWK